MTPLPTTWDAALAQLAVLVADPNLALGLVTVAVVLLLAAPLAWAVLTWARGARR